MKNHFLQAPTEHLSEEVKKTIKAWSSVPTPAEIRGTMAVAKSTGASDFAMQSLQRYLNTVLGLK